LQGERNGLSADQIVFHDLSMDQNVWSVKYIIAKITHLDSMT
jgi:hypothetical protein